MCTPVDRRSLLCIVPPHLLRAIAERGTPRSRKMALDALAVDGTMRMMRAIGAATATVRAGAAGRRTIYDARGSQRLPGTIARREGERATKDVTVNEAYTGLGATYDFYATVFGRDSIDDQGLPLDATVHFGRSYDNAFWSTLGSIPDSAGGGRSSVGSADIVSAFMVLLRPPDGRRATRPRQR